MKHFYEMTPFIIEAGISRRGREMKRRVFLSIHFRQAVFSPYLPLNRAAKLKRSFAVISPGSNQEFSNSWHGPKLCSKPFINNINIDWNI
jgi:hypothetical protein